MQYSSTLTLIVGAVIGGITGALAGALATRIQSAPPAPALAPEIPEAMPSDGSSSDSGVRELRTENQDLRRRVEVLENRSGSELRVPLEAAVTMEDLEALEERLKAKTTKIQAHALDDASLKEGVVQALGDIRAEERTQAQLAREQKQAGYMEERLARLSSKLGLSTVQVGEMRAIFTRQDEQNQELKRRWESGEDREGVGELKRSNWQEYQGSLQRVLTGEQLRLFQERPVGIKAQK